MKSNNPRSEEGVFKPLSEVENPFQHLVLAPNSDDVYVEA